MGWRKSRLLNLSKIILWVSVQNKSSNRNEWVVRVWPDLGDIENIESVGFSFFFWHHLNENRPSWVLSLLDRFEQISGGRIWVFLNFFVGLLSSQVLDALLSFEVVLDVVSLTSLVDPDKGV